VIKKEEEGGKMKTTTTTTTMGALEYHLTRHYQQNKKCNVNYEKQTIANSELIDNEVMMIKNLIID